MVGCCISLLGHVFITHVDGPAIYVLRLLYSTSVAGAFGAAITYVSLRAPVGRTAELIGVLGSSGFLGLAIGPTIGDWMFSSGSFDHASSSFLRRDINMMFYASAGVITISLVAAVLARDAPLRQNRRRRPASMRIVHRYWPGSIVLMGIAMGVGISLPSTFLRPFTEHLNIQRLQVYFFVYAVVAFVVRVTTRKLPDRWGAKKTALVGMALLVLSMLAYLVVQSEWSLAIPGALAGAAHAFLFPVIIAEGSVSFPIRYRGLGTALMLALFDAGGLFGQPTVGAIVRFAETTGWPAYPLMFVSVATGLTLTTLAFVLLSSSKSSFAVSKA